jgi:hypothetical protein
VEDRQTLSLAVSLSLKLAVPGSAPWSRLRPTGSPTPGVPLFSRWGWKLVEAFGLGWKQVPAEAEAEAAITPRAPGSCRWRQVPAADWLLSMRQAQQAAAAAAAGQQRRPTRSLLQWLCSP